MHRVAPAVTQSSFQRLEALISSPSIDGRFNLLEAVQLSSDLRIEEINIIRKRLGRLSHTSQGVIMEALAQRWAALDPVGAFQNARRETADGRWRDRLGAAASTALVARDPEAALDLISGAPSRALQQTIGAWILPALAKTNPARAAAYLATDKAFSRSRETVGMVAQHYGRIFPQDAIAWANGLPTMDAKSIALKMAWFGWAETNPQEVAATITRDGFRSVDPDVFQGITATWSKTDPFAALAWAETLPAGRTRDNAQMAVLAGVSELPPDEAQRLIASASSENVRKEFAEQFAKRLAQTDVNQALSWAEALPSGLARSEALNSVVQHWSVEDPAAAARYASTHANSKEGLNIFAHAYSQWVQSDPEAAFAYGQTLPRGKQRDAAAATAVNAMRDEDPQKAVAWYRNIEDATAAKSIAEGLLGSLVKTDPATAMQFASEIPADAQPKAYQNLVRNWAFSEPEKAGQWVNTLPHGEARDSAVVAYVSVIDGMDAGSAAKWANTITDPKKRASHTAQMVHRWMQNDRAAAAAWVQTSDFPPDVRQDLDRFLRQSQETRPDRD